MTPRISITRISDPQKAASVLLAETSQHLDDIRSRAWDHFQRRGQGAGNDWDDWLRAEREILWKPHAEMFQIRTAVVLRVAVPGFDARSLHITASPAWMLVRGSEAHFHEGLEARLHFCEFGQHLCRSFELPAPIDPSTVCASLDKGILEIVAGIARRPKPPNEAVADRPPERAPAPIALAAG